MSHTHLFAVAGFLHQQGIVIMCSLGSADMTYLSLRSSEVLGWVKYISNISPPRAVFSQENG